MNKQRGIFFCACALIFFLSFALFTKAKAAQEQNARKPAPRFAIEAPPTGGTAIQIGLRSTSVLRAERGTSSFFYPPFVGRIPDADATAAGQPPSALELAYRINGDLVEVRPTFYFGEFDRNKTPVSLAGLRKEELPVRSGGLYDSITIGELTRYGFQPLTIRIVSPEAEVPGHMLVESRAPSIQVSIVSEDRGHYLMAYKNTSSRACTAFSTTALPQPKGSGGWGGTGNGRGAVIAPGATRTQPYSGPAGFGSSDPPKTTIVLLAALFDDGSFEGDLEGAANLVALREGSRFQRQRIAELIDSIAADPDSNDATRISRIRAAVDNLTEEPDAQAVQSVHAHFPDLSEDAGTTVQRIIRSAMHGEKQTVNTFLDEYQRLKSEPNRIYKPTLAEFWKAWNRRM